MTDSKVYEKLDRYSPERLRKFNHYIGEKPEGGLVIPIGVDLETDELVTVDLEDPNTSQLLIAGTTGSGKTELIVSIVKALEKWYSADELDVFLYWRQNSKPLEIEEGGPVKRYDWRSSKEAQRYVYKVHGEMTRRWKEARVEKLEKPTVLVIDELLQLVEGEKALLNALVDIARYGRGAGIHLIVSSQRASSDAIPAAMKANMGAKVMLRTCSVLDSYIISGDDTNKDGFYLWGCGDMYLISGAVENRRLQGLLYER